MCGAVDVAWGQIRGGRQYQQDSVGIVTVAESCYLLVLADGMGGHQGGDVASATIVRSFCEAWKGSNAAVDVPTRLVSALEAANLAVQRRTVAQPGLDGMGATLLAVLIDDVELHWVSVGDSPLWMCRGGALSRLNANHSVAALLEQRVQQGEITAEEAAASPERSQLLEVVAGREIRLVDVSPAPFTLQSGDVAILASDGVETCPVSELEAVIGRRPETAADLAADIISAVEARGVYGQDNATVIVCVRQQKEALVSERGRE